MDVSRGNFVALELWGRAAEEGSTVRTLRRDKGESAVRGFSASFVCFIAVKQRGKNRVVICYLEGEGVLCVSCLTSK